MRATLEVLEPEVERQTRDVPLYKVILHNDDDTPMDFVVGILRTVFKKATADAGRIMMEAHEHGFALVEVVPYEQAELHVEQTRNLARARGYPLSLSIEPA